MKPLYLRIEMDITGVSLIDAEKAYRSITQEVVNHLPPGTWSKSMEFA